MQLFPLISIDEIHLDTWFHHLQSNILECQRGNVLAASNMGIGWWYAQQCELWVMRREKEGPSGVHFDSKVRRGKGMNLFVKCSIRIADRKIVVFHLPGHGISLSPFLNIRKVPKGSTACGKQVNIFQFAVEVVDKQCNYSPFFIIKGRKKCMDACPHPCTSVGFPNDFALKWANHISSIIKGNFGKPYHAFDVYFAFDGHCTGRCESRLSKPIVSMKYPAVP